MHYFFQNLYAQIRTQILTLASNMLFLVQQKIKPILLVNYFFCYVDYFSFNRLMSKKIIPRAFNLLVSTKYTLNSSFIH